MNEIILFITFQLLNVISATIKSIILIRCKNKFVAGLVNAINSAINFVVIKYTVNIDLYIIISATIMCNVIGTPLGSWIVDLISKDRLFIFNATIKCKLNQIQDLRQSLKNNYNIHSVYSEIVENQIYDLKLFSMNKEDSKIIKENLAKFNSKYHIIESR